MDDQTPDFIRYYILKMKLPSRAPPGIVPGYVRDRSDPDSAWFSSPQRSSPCRRTPRCSRARRSTRRPTSSPGWCSSSRRSSASPSSCWSTSCRRRSPRRRSIRRPRSIQTLCLLSLVFGGLLWPLAWLWAYTKPVLYKMAYGTDKVEHEHGAQRRTRRRHGRGGGTEAAARAGGRTGNQAGRQAGRRRGKGLTWNSCCLASTRFSPG